MTDVLQIANTLSKSFTKTHDAVALRALPFGQSFKKADLFGDVSLKAKGKFDFLSLHDEMRTDCSEKDGCIRATRNPHELNAAIRIAQVVPVGMNAAAEGFEQLVDDRFVGHADAAVEVVSNVDRVGFLPAVNSNKTLSIEETSNVANVHCLPQGMAEKVVNSGNTQTGQSRAKQAERPGVCNEHVPPAKAKMCSELGRNVERLTETISRFYVVLGRILHEKLTACNTNYIFLRPHKDRNFVPIGGERQAVNQDAIVKLIGWAGNVTSSGPQFCGVLKA